MNGGNETSGADSAGGPAATSVPVGWQRCVREGAVLYIRSGSPESGLLSPGPSALPSPPVRAQTAGAPLLSAPFLAQPLCPLPPVLCACSAGLSSSLSASPGRSLNCAFRVPSSSVRLASQPGPVLSQSEWHRAVFLGANPELPPQRWDLQVRSGVSTQRPQGQSGEGAAVRLGAGTDRGRSAPILLPQGPCLCLPPYRFSTLTLWPR